MEDEDDEFWTEERRKRLREKLEPELEQIRHDHIRFRALSGTLHELEEPPARQKRKPTRLTAFLFWLVLFILACLGIGALRLTLGW
jgi:hypothetical protein